MAAGRASLAVLLMVVISLQPRVVGTSALHSRLFQAPSATSPVQRRKSNRHTTGNSRRTRLVFPVWRAPVRTTTGRVAALPRSRSSIRRSIHMLQILRSHRRICTMISGGHPASPRMPAYATGATRPTRNLRMAGGGRGPAVAASWRMAGSGLRAPAPPGPGCPVSPSWLIWQRDSTNNDGQCRMSGRSGAGILVRGPHVGRAAARIPGYGST